MAKLLFPASLLLSSYVESSSSGVQGQLVRAFVASILVCGATTSANAIDTDCEKAGVAWHFQWENDSFPTASRGGSDRFYTNGIRISRSKNDDGGRFLNTVLDTVWFGGEQQHQSGFCARSSIRIGHQFYTPQTIVMPLLDVDDRPYAGLLYGTWGLGKASRLDDEEIGPKVIRTAEVQIGVVGPATGARSIQSEWHRVPFIDARTPLGWHNQLPNEFVANLNLTIARRIPFGDWFDVVPQFEANLGSIFTGARARTTFRFGRNLHVFPYERIKPVIMSSAPVQPKERSWWVFVGIEGEAVAHDIFLDGTLFSDSHSVETESFRMITTTGVHLEYKRLGIDLMWVSRSKEFETQRLGIDRHEYMSIGFTILPK